jgi:transposase-like protein
MRYNRLSDRKVSAIIRCFCEDITATSTAAIVGTSRNTVNAYFQMFRERIFHETLKESGLETGEFELDESYFGAKRLRGKRGRGAAGKTPVFGLLKRGGKVFVKIVPNCSKEALMPIIQGRILEGATIHTDGWKAYDGLILNGYEHYRVFHSENEFARGKSHVNGIESFWSFAKRRLAKFNGCKNEHFMIHLKETEFRFNHRKENLYKIIKKIIKSL